MRQIFIAIFAIVCSFGWAETIRIEPAKRQCVILLPAKANFGLKFAAEELSYHVEKLTGTKLEARTEPTDLPDGTFVFSLGETDFAQKHGVSGVGMAHNHAQFLGDNDKMILTGNDRGDNLAALLIDTNATLFALYDILENENDCHWLWPGELGECIPKTGCFQFTAGRREVSTKLKFFFWRQLWGNKAQWPSPEAFSHFMTAEVRWLLRHRSNRDLSEQHYPHAFESWPGKYLKTHPEFFNLLPDGTRRPSPLNWGGQSKLISMCTGSPAFRQQIVKDWLENFNPKIPRINLKSNDSNLQCVCDDCMADDHSPIPTEERRARAKARYDKGDPAWMEELGDLSRRQIEFYHGVMAEADRIAPEKKAKFAGLIYANSANAPENTFLGPRFQFCYCPSMYFPWTDEKIDYYTKNWDGWYKTGVDLVIRPNYTLDGHCYPIAYDRDFHHCFLFAEPRALKGSDYDSLTGMYAAQGLTLYTIARLQNSRPGLPFETIETEYCSAFGDAAPMVREYFDRLWKISHNSKPTAKSSNRPEGGYWAHYYLAGHDLFTARIFAELNQILQEAKQVLPVESVEAKRIHFLWLGLENARLTAETAASYDAFRTSGDYMAFAEKVKALDKFREDNAFSQAFNIGFCREREDNHWPRELAKQMTKDTIPLPIDWPFKTDPDKNGEAKGWHTVDYDESQWETIPTDRPWDKSGYETYDGFGWYRLRVRLPEKLPGEPILMVGSADEACDIWINGRKVLHRPYPFEGNANSWNEAFNVPFGDVARSGENIIAIRVEDNNGQGGLTKRCFLKFRPDHDEKNALRNANFEDGTDQWQLVQRYGVNKATAMQFDGRNALCCEVITPSPNALYSNKYRNYLMLHQAIAKLVKGKKYLVTVEFRTSPDYDGIMMVFCHADVQRERQSESNIQLGHTGPMPQWVTLSKPFVANMDSGDFYLNYVCNHGKLYFSSVSIREME